MDKDDFGIDKLMPQTSQPQRFGPSETSQQFEAKFAEQYIKECHKYEYMDEDDFGIDKLKIMAHCVML